MSRKLEGKKAEMQNTSKLPYFKKKLTKREMKVVDYLFKQDDYVTTAQIMENTGFDFRSTCDVMKSLYRGMLVYREIKKYSALKHQNGGVRHKYLYLLNKFALDCLPYHRNTNIPTTTLDIKQIIKRVKKDRTLFNKLFKFKEQ